MENSAEKQEKSLSPSVSVDGAKVRSIRETNKLTQLYVANVVGVTTDTISRWENNRYPTIKRDNAEKLATALDVELTEILKPEESPAAPQEPPLPDGNRRMRVTVLLIGIVLVIAAAALFFRQMATHPVAVRKLPRFGAPGEVIPVQIRVTRNSPDSAGFILKERLPDGWRLVASSPPAPSGQLSMKEVKWLVPAGSGQVTISYTAQITPTAPLKTDAAFKGSTVSTAEGFSRTEEVGGDRVVKVAKVHWADADGDGRIDDDEIMPAYYLTEEMKGLGLDWKIIEAIWNARGYVWEPQKRGFAVVK